MRGLRKLRTLNSLFLRDGLKPLDRDTFPLSQIVTKAKLSSPAVYVRVGPPIVEEPSFGTEDRITSSNNNRNIKDQNSKLINALPTKAMVLPEKMYRGTFCRNGEIAQCLIVYAVSNI